MVYTTNGQADSGETLAKHVAIGESHQEQRLAFRMRGKFEVCLPELSSLAPQAVDSCTASWSTGDFSVRSQWSHPGQFRGSHKWLWKSESTERHTLSR